MSQSTDPRSGDGCELPPVTCWPLILGAGAFVALGAALAACLFVGDWLRPLLARPEQAAATPKESPEPTTRIDRGPETGGVRDQGRAVVVARLVRERERMPGAREAEQEKAKAPEFARLRQKRRPAKPDDVREPAALGVTELLPSLLEASRELDLEAKAGTGERLLRAAKEHAPSTNSAAIEEVLEVRHDLRGLPLLAGKSCECDSEQAEALGTMSRGFRRAEELALSEISSRDHPLDVITGVGAPKLLAFLTKSVADAKRRPLLVRPIEQIYQTGYEPMREGMVKALKGIDGKEATRAIARRAAFDPSPTVRQKAVAALKKRGRDEAREVFLAALRHPWAPAADNAARALVDLGDENAASALKEMLDEPAPSHPYQDGEGRWVRRELVRVNHLGNCLLCHAASIAEDDPIRAPVPTRGQSLPARYYGDSFRGPAVRADVVYFRQDFSAWHNVQNPNKWPIYQRFDYLVRVRELTGEEAEAAIRAKPSKTYPQREAVRWALAQLDPVLRR